MMRISGSMQIANQAMIPLILAFWLVAISSADESLVQRYRIIGLSSSERESDLREVVKQLPELQLEGINLDQAEVTLRYDLAKLFPNHKTTEKITPEQMLQRLNQVVGGVSSSTFTFAPLPLESNEKLVKLEIQLGLLDCKACRYGAYLAVMKLPGIDRALIAPKTNLLTLWSDATKIERLAIEEALKKANVVLPPP